MKRNLPSRSIARTAFGALLAIGFAASAVAAPQGSLPSGCQSTDCVDAIQNPSPHDPSHPQWWRYVPPETVATPHPMQHLAIFVPVGTPPPSGWPVILHSNVGGFLEPLAWCDGTRGAITRLCGDHHGDLKTFLQGGWAIVSVSGVGTDSVISGQEANVFFPAGSAEWEDFDLFWGEKDFTWARQWVAENAAGLSLDNDRVIAWGTSAGGVYAAWIALGPTRVFLGATSSQSGQDTRCAGYVGDLPLAWLPAYADVYPALHWPDVNGQAAPTVADVAPGILAAASPSTWIRAAASHAIDTPVCLAGDEFVDTYTFDRDVQNDPTLTNAFDPPVDPLHPSWFPLTLAEDLMILDPDFHAIQSLFLISDLVTDLGSVGPPHSGYVDLLFGGTIAENDLQLLHGYWLRKFTDPVGASATVRNGTGINTPCYGTSDTPVIGGTWSVALDFTAHGGSGFWGLYGYGSALTFLLNGLGQELLLNPLSGQIFSTFGVGTSNPYPIDLPIPADPALMGVSFSTQAFTQSGPVGILLCNAIDLVLGY
ncbi:MAG: hypothetical protein AB1726_17640 [Planctomycetota bacterium]